ncbi:Uncharacterised protein [Vibrio cholerae]|nr:Uncharacterised protein [Vibrio cholerae]
MPIIQWKCSVLGELMRGYMVLGKWWAVLAGGK